LSISGLHVGFLAAWLALLLRKLGLRPSHRPIASGVLLLGYLWLLGFPAPALRATTMLVVDDVARLRQRVAAPRGVIALSALAVPWVGPGLAALLAAGSGLGLALLDLTAQGAAAVPGGHVIMVPGWGAAGVWLAVAVVAWWLWNTPRRPWLIAARVAFVTTVFVATTLRDVVTLDACRCLTVSFLDVGQGDAAVLRTPNGRWIVIDGGPRIPGSDAGRRVVVPFLRRHGAGR